jgi:serine/threonine-protein kinase HipA
MHTTSIAGESRNPNTKHLKELASHFNVKKPSIIFDEVATSINQFTELAKNFEISKETINLIKKNIN